jgi:hypothetical protein
MMVELRKSGCVDQQESRVPEDLIGHSDMQRCGTPVEERNGSGTPAGRGTENPRRGLMAG